MTRRRILTVGPEQPRSSTSQQNHDSTDALNCRAHPVARLADDSTSSPTTSTDQSGSSADDRDTSIYDAKPPKRAVRLSHS